MIEGQRGDFFGGQLENLIENFEFKHPSNAYFLILALVAATFFVLSFFKRGRAIATLRLGYKARFRAVRTVLLCLGLCLMVLALMGPQAYSGDIEVSKAGLDIYVLMDTSKSMLVTDIAPDRLTVAKRIVGSMLDSLEGDRVGFIPFASDAYIQMPLTDDYQLAKMFLDVMDTDMIGGGGTNLAAAMRLANGSFERASGADRVILILSDGEEHDGASLEALKSITDDQVKIFAVGIGTERGGLIPIYNEAGDAVASFMYDDGGNPVTSRLDATTLVQLAGGGRGLYFQADMQGSETSALLNELSALKRDDYEMRSIKTYSPLYQYFLGPGILLFLLAWFLPEGGVDK